MNFRKKGVSPLIATILLIVVAVILVTIVLTWGKNFATDSLAKTGDVVSDNCSGSSIALSNCQISGTAVVFTVRNNSSNNYTFPATDVPQVFLRDEAGGSYTSELDLNLSSGAAWSTALTPGEMRGAKAAVGSLTGDVITVTVRSQTCPNDAIDTIVCR